MVIFLINFGENICGILFEKCYMKCYFLDLGLTYAKLIKFLDFFN